jgi:hypothetical protein
MTVLQDPEGLIAGFIARANEIGLGNLSGLLRAEHLAAPHRQPTKLASPAVYVFSLSESYGRDVPAGPNRVLKVGMVGPKSAARFISQHYGLSAPSTLAGSLLRETILWRYLGIENLDASNVKAWMQANLERDHVFVPPDREGLARHVERYYRGHLGPVFEG